MDNFASVEMVTGTWVDHILTTFGSFAKRDKIGEVLDFERAGDDGKENGCFKMGKVSFNDGERCLLGVVSMMEGEGEREVGLHGSMG